MSALYFSRARLRAGRGEALAPLARALLGATKGDVIAQAHRIVWMLFNDGSDRPINAGGEDRLFLWREKSPGEYYILSREAPDNRHGLFDLDTQEFTPKLAAGDTLRFTLRANPVVSPKSGWDEGKEKRDGKGRVRGKRCDIVMAALKPFEGKRDRDKRTEPTDKERLEPTERAEKREAETAKAARVWLEAQGRKAGFALVPNPDADEADSVFLAASNYETVRIPRIRGDGATFGVLDFEGLIEITDPALFLARLVDGFGSAKAFGCGLMLIRRG
ncbi:type I-E CRISPR-associated protein Cas6/Cse3/CasE [Rhodomicrobium sp. Az07]|uniref:type I-E CRISPR-associated protein Cas6/Cse3/CasE n=1 Tax=Rhodomicrobium sp. Az07 TaxID=2839034 RepID=UPI001BE94534|nr:type I-E CRISPR-associated protein Cas6/Cse3/CasE [Rhodomicrobium sp. Az07]MBT3070567.1 type I-E CRISPR-associated protein Cas6/Cse3/CasE [Rhodomicrobium sp. Az07]